MTGLGVPCRFQRHRFGLDNNNTGLIEITLEVFFSFRSGKLRDRIASSVIHDHGDYNLD